MVKISIEKNDAQQRLDRFLKKYLKNAPLSYIYKAIRKDVKVNGRRAKEDTILEEGDEISLYIADEEFERLTEVRKQVRVKKQFRVAYEDENIIVVEKPFGLLTHGDAHEKKNTLANQVVDYLIEKGDFIPRMEKTFTPAPANRLDRNTTGLVIFGKNAAALKELNRMLKTREGVAKYYLTIAKGEIKDTLVLKDRAVKDHEKNMVRVVSGDEGKEIETTIRPVETNGRYTLAEAELITGRTHQIRVHLKKAGYPLVGDSKYGDPKTNRFVSEKYGLNTQLLHAYRLSFGDVSGMLSYLSGTEIISELPDQFRRIKEGLIDG